ncbi:MAG: FMN-binding protein [Phycisphaerae bacterium]|nr:FMN-binding protein [Phycisphaerae bacterium]
MGSMLKQIWLVLVLSLIFAVALAFVDQGTAQRIAENRQQQVQALAQMAILGEPAVGADGQMQFKIKLEPVAIQDVQAAFRVTPAEGGDETLGYAVVVEGIGWDRLLILVGLSPDLQRITGVQIVESRETPGLGERIGDEAWRDQFRKPTAQPLELVKGRAQSPYQVEALTGATISSDAVTSLVNEATAKALAQLK